MDAVTRGVFVGSDCPVNKYGAARRVYGLADAPCKQVRCVAGQRLLMHPPRRDSLMLTGGCVLLGVALPSCLPASYSVPPT
jgi:hypothetical protein